jgi:hypothetical protein
MYVRHRPGTLDRPELHLHRLRRHAHLLRLARLVVTATALLRQRHPRGNNFGNPSASGAASPRRHARNGARTARNWTIRRNLFEDSANFGPMSGGVRRGNIGEIDTAWKQPCT